MGIESSRRLYTTTMTMGPILLGFFTICLLVIFFGAVNGDEGWYLYAGRSVYEGHRLYTDFAFSQMPLAAYVYGIGQVLEPGLITGRVTSFALVALAAVATILVARRLGLQRERLMIVSALVLLNSSALYYLLITKTYALSWLLLASALLCWTYVREKPLVGLPATALFLALLTLTRLSFLPVVLVLLWFAYQEEQTKWSVVVPAALFAATLGAGLLLLGSMDNLIFNVSSSHWDLRYNGDALPNIAFGFMKARILALTEVVRMWWPVFVFSALAALGRPKLERIDVALVLVITAAVLPLLAAPAMYAEYFTPLMPFVAVLAVRAWQPRGVKWALSAGVFLALASALTLDASLLLTRSAWPNALEAPAAAISAQRPDALVTFEADLAVESGVALRKGFEMGSFSLFAGKPTNEALRQHVLNEELVLEALRQPGTLGALTTSELEELGLLECLRGESCRRFRFDLVDTFRAVGDGREKLYVFRVGAPSSTAK